MTTAHTMAPPAHVEPDIVANVGFSCKTAAPLQPIIGGLPGQNHIILGKVGSAPQVTPFDQPPPGGAPYLAAIVPSAL